MGFSKNISDDIYNGSLKLRPFSGTDYKQNESMMQLTPVRAFMLTAQWCLERTEVLSSHRLNVYENTPTSHVGETARQLIGPVCKILAELKAWRTGIVTHLCRERFCRGRKKYVRQNNQWLLFGLDLLMLMLMKELTGRRTSTMLNDGQRTEKTKTGHHEDVAWRMSNSVSTKFSASSQNPVPNKFKCLQHNGDVDEWSFLRRGFQQVLLGWR